MRFQIAVARRGLLVAGFTVALSAGALPMGQRSVALPLSSAPPAVVAVFDAKAAAAFSEILRQPTDVSIRKSLLERYRELKAEPAGMIISATIALLETHRWKSPASASPAGVPCPSIVGREERIQGMQEAIAAVPDGLWSTKNVVLAEEAIEKEGAACELVAQWAHAVLYSQVLPEGPDTWLRREAAFRVILLMADRANAFPVGLEGAAPVYAFAGDWFVGHGDRFTALVCYRIALARLQAGSTTGGITATGLERKLRQYIGALGQQLGIQGGG